MHLRASSPPLHEDVHDLRRARVDWLGATTSGVLAGALARSEDDREVEIDRLVVDPRVHRQGVGSALVTEVLHRAGARDTVVATGRDDLPARSLDERLGFTPIGDQEVLPGLWISRYRHAPRHADSTSDARPHPE